MFKIQNKTCSGIMQIKVLSKAEGVMCVWGGGYNFSIGSKKFKLCLENKTVPGAQLKVLGYKIMQHQSLISFNLLNISTFNILKKHVLIKGGGFFWVQKRQLQIFGLRS